LSLAAVIVAVVVVMVVADAFLVAVVFVASSGTDLCYNVVDVTSSSALDVVEIQT
jgi:hypothetical protein